MSHTSYADISGIDNHSVSTAQDQMLVVEPLMQSELVRQIVSQTSVVLPGAGEVHTYTPMLGTKGVVGIKSGRTDAAGGCDAMAVEDQRAGRSFLIYSVVLGQRGKDLLVAAGRAAYSVAMSAANQVVVGNLHDGQVIGAAGWQGSSSAVIVRGNAWALWWRRAPSLTLTWHVNRPVITSGETVAVINPYQCSNCIRYGTITLTVRHDIARPPWWNGLR
jgi:D-alanyl-D-alanine carboxypeptidase (penicillin-binding protein 5/6)